MINRVMIGQIYKSQHILREQKLAIAELLEKALLLFYHDHNNYSSSLILMAQTGDSYECYPDQYSIILCTWHQFS